MVKRGNRYDFGAVRFSRQWDGDVFSWKRKNQSEDEDGNNMLELLSLCAWATPLTQV